MKYSILALTVVSCLLFSGCNRDYSCTSCAHSETEQPTCSTCPTNLPLEQIIETDTEIVPNDEIEEIVIDETISQK